MGFECGNLNIPNEFEDKATMTVVAAFWENIRDWLNNSVVDVVQEHIGYDARKTIFKAVNKVEIEGDQVRFVSQVYCRRNSESDCYDKVTMEAKAPVKEIDKEIIKLINERGFLIHEMEYEK